MNDKILLILPTRGRPWSALESIASLMKTADEPDKIALCVCCDQDDEKQLHLSVGPGRPSLPINSVIGLRRRFVEWTNEITMWNIVKYKFGFSHLAWWGDDVRMQRVSQQGWDTIVRSHKELVVYGDDLYHREKMATHPFIRAEIPKALGYLLPSELIHSCADTFIEELARACDSIAYDPRIVTEHLHPDAKKGVWDQTYQDARDLYAQDLKTMNEVVRPRIPELAKKVMAYLGKT